MKAIQTYPLFLWLLPLFFFLVGYTDHGYFLHIHKLFPSYLLLYGLIHLAYFGLRKINKNKILSALLVFYVAGVYLFFGGIKGRFDQLVHCQSYILLLFFLTTMPFVLHYFFLKRKNDFEQKIFTYCNVLMIVLCITQCVLIGLAQRKDEKYAIQKITLSETTKQQLPSIHLILWDGYPGFISLTEHFKFDNADLKMWLRDKNYFVFDTMHSNYFQTYISVNSLLNMQYVSYLHQVPLNTYHTVLHQLKQINENQLVQFLNKYNYQINNNSVFEIDDQEVLHQNPKFKNSEAIHFNEVFHNRLLKDNLRKFAYGKYRLQFAFNRIVMNQYHQNHSSIDQLLNSKPTHPHFTYTHLLMPHEPYFTDSSGHLRDMDLTSKDSTAAVLIGYLRYTNKKMMEMVTHLSETEPNSIVVIMSDHGYREYTDEKDLPKKFNNLMAVYLPDSDYSQIRNLKSNVNLFRMILNQYFDQKLPVLKDSCIIIDEEKNKIISNPL